LSPSPPESPTCNSASEVRASGAPRTDEGMKKPNAITRASSAPQPVYCRGLNHLSSRSRRRWTRSSLNLSTTPVLVGIINPWIWLIVIQRCRRLPDTLSGRRCIGPTRSRTHDQASVGMGNGMPVSMMMYRGGVGGSTQREEEARGQKIAHRNRSKSNCNADLRGAPAAPSQRTAGSRSITSASFVPMPGRSHPRESPSGRKGWPTLRYPPSVGVIQYRSR